MEGEGEFVIPQIDREAAGICRDHGVEKLLAQATRPSPEFDQIGIGQQMWSGGRERHEALCVVVINFQNGPYAPQ